MKIEKREVIITTTEEDDMLSDMREFLGKIYCNTNGNSVIHQIVCNIDDLLNDLNKYIE